MNRYEEIDKVYDRITDGIHKLAEKVLEMLNDEVSKEMEEAYKEFGTYQKSYIQKTFNESISAFYSAYQPHKYKRTFGLYDVLDLKTDEYGIVQAEGPHYDELYDETKMHADRSGYDSLFDTVFKEGYHGGAPTIGWAWGKSELWGPHPEPGIPYYRRGGFVKYPGSNTKKWHRYGRWGRRAVKTKSPYIMMYEWLSKAEGGEIYDAFKQISQRHNDDAVARVVAKIPDMRAKIMG